MKVRGFVREDAVDEMRLALERLQRSLVDGISDEFTPAQKNDAMRKAYGYSAVISDHLQGIKTVHVCEQIGAA